MAIEEGENKDKRIKILHLILFQNHLIEINTVSQLQGKEVTLIKEYIYISHWEDHFFLYSLEVLYCP